MPPPFGGWNKVAMRDETAASRRRIFEKNASRQASRQASKESDMVNANNAGSEIGDSPSHRNKKNVRLPPLGANGLDINETTASSGDDAK